MHHICTFDGAKYECGGACGIHFTDRVIARYGHCNHSWYEITKKNYVCRYCGRMSEFEDVVNTCPGIPYVDAMPERPVEDACLWHELRITLHDGQRLLIYGTANGLANAESHLWDSYEQLTRIIGIQKSGNSGAGVILPESSLVISHSEVMATELREAPQFTWAVQPNNLEAVASGEEQL